MKPLHPYLLSIFMLSTFLLNAQISTRKAIATNWSDSTLLDTARLDKTKEEILFTELYLKTGAQPVFTHGMGLMFLSYLEGTKIWGFNPEHYKYSLLDSLFHSNSPEGKATFDIQASHAYIALYEDILNGALKDESTRGYKIHFDLEKVDPLFLLQSLQQLPSINYLKLAEPNILAYKETKKQLEHYYFDTIYPSSSFFALDSLRLGDKDSLIAPLREALYYHGDLKMTHRLRSKIFDKDVLQALNDFKTRHLLPADSLLDDKTVAFLNLPIEGLIKELQLNMERWRWLPTSLGTYYAKANLPAYEMSLIKNDTLLMKQRMVCGKVSRSTPAFSDTMRYMDINPTWTVPPTILQKDILPSAKSSGTYLSRKNIKVLDVTTGHYISSSEINWANSKNYKFVQGPGFSNALGVVKFIFPNPYYIFFHDTPHKEHFPLKYRAYSSGCIRLQHPRDFAEILLTNNDVSFTRAEIDSIVGTQKTKRILLNEKPVVYITYITQDFQEGLLFTYPDVYGYNEELERNLKIHQEL